MNKIAGIIGILIILISCSENKNTSKNQLVKSGDFSISLPDFMKKSENISSEGKVEYMFKDENHFLFCVVYKDLKKEYKKNFSLKDYYNYIANDILNNYLDYGSLKPPKEIEINGIAAMQFEMDGILLHSPGDENSFFLETVIESDSAFYEIRTWTSYSSKDKFKKDMMDIAESFQLTGGK